jgi:hypothetical protein
MRTIFVNNRFIVSISEIVLEHEIKWTIFVNLSTTTNTELNPLLFGRSVIKSDEMDAMA